MEAALKAFFLLLILTVVGLLGYQAYSGKLSTLAPRPPQVQTFSDSDDRVDSAGSSLIPSDFKCDGRTHCSQMKSCAEATYFVQQCPNTQMDGNGDGVPCESQWCN